MKAVLEYCFMKSGKTGKLNVFKVSERTVMHGISLQTLMLLEVHEFEALI
jgi:hypothetical protein